mmetsp:Transcript_72789/g.173428  ORF Transcript_72789/g.173428 Transcript_72789/m.173428 type:complete len:558 (-) Transcript_72789:36-1709(-)
MLPGGERRRLLSSGDGRVGDYQTLQDPEMGPSKSQRRDEAKRFKKLLKGSTGAAPATHAGAPGDKKTSAELERMRRTIAARKERERLKNLRGGQGHTFLYSLVSAHSHRTEAVCFRHFIGSLILLNVVCFVLETDKNLSNRFAAFFDNVEGVSSCIFLIEYIIRIATIPENKRYMHMSPWMARLSWSCTFSSIVDLVSFLPFFVEVLLPYELPNLQCVRVVRLFRLFKSNSVMGSFDVIARVLYYNGEMLCVAFLIDVILILLMSTIMYYLAPPENTPGLEDSFASIPATMYLSVMMLTGQGQPAGQLPWYTKLIVVLTAILATAQFAIPASMLTWGFEQEAERRINKNHEAREKQRDRILRGDSSWAAAEVSSSSTSESDLGHEWDEYEAVVVGSDSDSSSSGGGSAAVSSGPGLSAAEAARIAKIFSTLDADENGTLATSEICRIASGRVDADSLSNMLDADNDGLTTSEEFVGWLTNIKSKSSYVFGMIMGDLENLKPAKKKQLDTDALASLPDQLMQFAEQFRVLSEQVQKLRDEVASKDAEIAQLKYQREKK